MKFFGFLILVFGAIMLLGNFGVVPHYSIGEVFSSFWPVLLIYWGAVGMWHGWRRRYEPYSAIGSLIMFLFGVGFLLDNLHLSVFPFSVWNLLVPVGFIIVGLNILFGRKRRWTKFPTISIKKDGREMNVVDFGTTSAEVSELPGNGRRFGGLFGDIKIGGPNWKLENSRIDLKAGSIRVDLRETSIPEGETVLEVYCKAGDVDVILPGGVSVWAEAGVKLGDLRLLDQRNSGTGMLHYRSDDYDTAERKIKLRVFVKIGDIDVKRFG